MKKFFLFALFICSSVHFFASNQIRIMTYNLMYYGVPLASDTSPFCTELNNNVANKNKNLRSIIDYTLPDIFGVNEIRSDSTNFKLILDSVLNTNGRQNYKTAQFNQSYFQARNSPYILLNPIFYNSSKLTLYNFESVSTGSSRDAFFCTFFVNSSVNNPYSDTVFITCIQAHLKAGNTTSDESQRGIESIKIMQKIENSHFQGNVLVMGDFNSYSSADKGVSNFINWGNRDFTFFDPVNKPGVWSVNEQFKSYHTQSTHYYSNGCFSGGGLDDRLDFILIQRSLIEGSKSLTYIDGSYTTVGQDGKHFNNAVNYQGNSSVPSNIANALYEVSDHLPVFLDIDVAIPLQATKYKKRTIEVKNLINHSVEITTQSASSNVGIVVFDLNGSVVKMSKYNQIKANQTIHVDLSRNAKGVYFIKFIDHQNNFVATKKFIR